MIRYLILQLFFLPSAFPATASDFTALLNQPIDVRLIPFRQARLAGENFLRRTAFDKSVRLQSRWRAITTLGRLDAKHFQGDLERALTSKEWFMRNAALIALQTADRETAVKWSTRLVTDPALVVRTQAVRNLIQLNGREAEPLLWQEIFSVRNFRGHQSLWVRAHMAEALARFGSNGKAKSFAKLLLEPDERLHKWAVLGLENSTGFKMSGKGEPVEVSRQKWLARLESQAI